MGKGNPLLQWAAGLGALAAPPHVQAALLAGGLALRALGALAAAGRRRREARAGGAPPSPPEAAEPPPVALEWRHLTVTLEAPRPPAGDPPAPPRVLLADADGAAAPGRLLAICGPSGSGKTTLLGAISGRLPAARRLRARGDVRANGAPLARSGVVPGFIAQEDIFFSQLTVRETLDMTAELRMPPGTPAAARAAAVDAAIARLGLAKCARTRVGDAKTRGLSGGEKKRLAIACELVARPRLVLADEPTTGLDAFGALQVMRALSALAAGGHTVVATIHQPRSAIYELFDDILLLAEGRVVYHGPAREAVLDHFAALGHPIPAHFNPAEFLSDLVSVDTSSPEAAAASATRVRTLARAWRRRVAARRAGGAGAGAEPAAPPPAPAPAPAPAARHLGLPRAAALLARRAWRQVARDRATAASRAASQASSALVFSAIYWRLGRGVSAAQDRLGLLQVSAVGTAMSSLIKTLNVFPRERALVARERERAGYGAAPYLAAKLAAELPVGAAFPALFGALLYPAAGLAPGPRRFATFLGVLAAESFAAQGLGLAVGAAAPSTEAALAIGPAAILVSIVFGGLFVSADNVPRGLAWLARTSLIRHAFSALAVNELRGAAFEADGTGPAASGDDVLRRASLGGATVGGALAAQGRVILAYWWTTLCVLRARQPAYAALEPPAPDEFDSEDEAEAEAEAALE